MTPLLTASGISLAGRLEPLDLSLDSGGLTAVIGPNGGGKTSLLRALARVERAGGKVSIDGEDVDRTPAARRRRMLSFLPAAREMPWPIAARDVIALGLGQADPARVEELIALLGLEALADRRTDLLSTGERARVLFARAMAARPRLLLLDEPLSNLDPYWALTILDQIRQAVSAKRAAALVSLHDLALLERFDRVLLVGAGVVHADGTADEVLGDRAFERLFGVVPSGTGWRISPGRQADRRSSQ